MSETKEETMKQKLKKLETEVNQRMPGLPQGVRYAYKVKVYKDRIDVTSAEYASLNVTDRIKPVRGVLKTPITKSNKKNYTWEEIVQAFLLGCQTPILIFDTVHQKLVEEDQKKMKLDAKIAKHQQELELKRSASIKKYQDNKKARIETN